MPAMSVRFLFSILLLLATLPAAFAQTPLPLPNPNLDLRQPSVNFSAATSAVALADGGAIIPYAADRIGGQAGRRGLVKLRPDGSIDPAWSVTGSSIFAMALDGDDLYLAGNFFSINGVHRRGLARVSVATGAMSAWAPNVDSESDFVFHSIAVSGGKVYVGGEFTEMGTAVRRNLAKIATDSTGTLDLAWNVDTNDAVWSVVATGSAIYIGGEFTQVRGLSRRALAKLNTTDGTLDSAWVPSLSPQSDVRSAVSDGSHYYFTGCYGSVNGTARSYLARIALTGAGALDTTWNPNPNSGCTAGLAVTATHAYVGGFFTQMGGQPAVGVARVSKSGAGALDTAWQPGIEGRNVSTIVPLNDGSTILMGDFVAVGGSYSPAIARVSASGALTGPGIHAENRGRVFALLPTADGGTLVGGRFSAMGNTPRGGLVKLNPDGTHDASFTTDVQLGDVLALQRDASHLYVGGSFGAIGGVARSGLARISPAGVVDAWNPGPNSRVAAIAFDEGDNTAIVGGYFFAIGGQSRNRLAKISRSTGLATAWNANVTGSAVTALLASNDLYVGGTFSSIGGATRGNLARISLATGLADAAFAGNANGSVNALMPGPAGTLYLGGTFTTLNGTPSAGIGRVFDSSGLADPAWNTFPGSANVAALAPSADGTSFYVAGAFNTFGGVPRSLARVTHAGTVTDFAPDAVGTVALVEQGNRLLAGGTLNAFAPATTTQIGVLAFPVTLPDLIFCDGFEGAGCVP